MPRLFDQFYRVKRRDNLGDPDFWNSRFDDVDRRIAASEEANANIDLVLANLENIALDRINLAITPLVQETQTQLRSIANLFRAGSVSTVGMSTGPKNFVILESERNTFAALDYVSIRSTEDPSKSMMGRVVSFNRDTGLLEVDVEGVLGTGTFHSWTITVSSPPDLVHAGRTDNPHNVTAEQVGAISAETVDAKDADVKNSLLGGVSTTYDSLKKLSDYTVAQITSLNSALSGKAPTDHNHDTRYYTKAETTALVGTSKVNGTVVLVRVSDTQLRLDPMDGGYLMVSGIMETVPSAGVTVSNSGLVSGTRYYVYCYKNGASLALELATTVPVRDGTGVMIKTGNATRTLVGMVKMTSTNTFKDDEAGRLVRSWYKDKGVVCRRHYTADRNETANGSMSVIDDEVAQEFVAFKDEIVSYSFTGTCYNNTSSATSTVMGAWNGDLSETSYTTNAKVTFKSWGSSTYDTPVGISHNVLIGADAAITLNITGRVSAGTLVARAGGLLSTFIAPRN